VEAEGGRAGGGRYHTLMRWGGVPGPTGRRRPGGNGPPAVLEGWWLAVPHGRHKIAKAGSLACRPGGHCNRRHHRI
jgi:hypothetical protein